MKEIVYLVYYLVVLKQMVYSLIRKVLDNLDDITGIDLKSMVRVHKSYLNEINDIKSKCKIHGLCHITGGGFTDNLPRVLPALIAVLK